MDLPALKSRLVQRAVPRLILIQGDEEPAPFRALTLMFADLDEALDCRLEVIRIGGGPGAGADLLAWLREVSKGEVGEPGRPGWLLLDRKGALLASGASVPSSERLQEALALAGLEGPSAVLNRFIAQEPDHAEALRDLLQVQRGHLRARLSRIPKDGAVELDPITDQRIWGRLAVLINKLMDLGDWMPLGLCLEGLLPPGLPERNSPCMLALYRKQRPRIQNLVRRYPENTTLWLDLRRMDRVLDLVPPMREWREVALEIPPGTSPRSMNAHALGRALTTDARETGDWSLAYHALAQLWPPVRAQLRLSTLVRLGEERREPRPDELAQVVHQDREVAWNLLLEPLVESMIRTHHEGEIPGLLKTLDASWIGLELPSRLRSLARRLGRADLLPTWLVSLQAPDPALPVEGLLGVEWRVFFQGALDEGRMRACEGCLAWHGLVVPFVPSSKAWRKRLGWKEDGTHWALVDSEGHVWLEGRGFPEAEAFEASLQEARIPFADQMLQNRMLQSPGRIRWLAEWAQVHVTRSIACGPTAMDLHGKDVSASKETGEQARLRMIECWKAYLQAVVSLLSDPAGTHPDLLTLAAPYGFSRRLLSAGLELPSRDDGHESSVAWTDGDLERQVLALLENHLRRRPSDPALWDLWVEVQPWSTGFPVEMLARWRQSPMSAPGSWPSADLLLSLSLSLKRKGDWRGLLDLLNPRWAIVYGTVPSPGPRAVGAPQASSAPWNGRLTRLMLEALVRLGRIGEAEERVVLLKGKGEVLEDALGLKVVAESAGAGEWARRSLGAWVH